MTTIFWCTSCLNASTRPRLTFDDQGRCSACQWHTKKPTIDWERRTNQFKEVVESVSTPDTPFDCLVPVSGGKDGSYVAHTIREQYGLTPLCVTVRPPLELPVSNRNLLNFVNSGFDHILVTPNPEIMATIDRYGFEDLGFPYYGWLTAIHTAVIRTAIAYSVPLVVYGEDGEVEYGGSTEKENEQVYNIEYMRTIYLEGGHDSVMRRLGDRQAHAHFWEFPSTKSDLIFTHWSYYEPWDSYKNYLVAKEHCGLEESQQANAGTFTNYAQNDQALVALHTYLMYLKFGFGRATADVGIEIRRGAMSRDQAIHLVRMYDGAFPSDFIPTYLEYYKMTSEEFDAVLDRWANKSLFEKIQDRWCPLFQVK